MQEIVSGSPVSKRTELNDAKRKLERAAENWPAVRESNDIRDALFPLFGSEGIGSSLVSF